MITRENFIRLETVAEYASVSVFVRGAFCNQRDSFTEDEVIAMHVVTFHVYCNLLFPDQDNRDRVTQEMDAVGLNPSDVLDAMDNICL